MDEDADERIREAAQGLIAFAFCEVGAFVGTQLAGLSSASHTLSELAGSVAHDWYGVWINPAWRRRAC